MMDKRNLLLTLQLSVLGIVVVFGLFWILRSIRRLEDKLQIVIDEVKMDRAASGMWNPQQCGLPNFKEAEEAMAHLFASDPEILLTSPFAPKTQSDQVVIEEDVQDVVAEEPKETVPKTIVFPPPKANVQVDESVSELDLEGDGKLSKTKIKKMSLDQLRLECGKLSLAIDGTRKELMDRLLATLTN
jgi:hypothetical protein